MINLKEYRIDGSTHFKLSEFKTDYSEEIESKEKAEEILSENIKKMRKLQGKLFAQNNYAVLIIFQAMDTAGKDGAIKHVMTGLNPQGTKVHSFKEPSAEDLNHDYMWRAILHLPERGQIGIFNRSYYEELLVVRVHDLIKKQKIPSELIDNIWEKRFQQIKEYENYLHENGTVIIKVFLHISKDEQCKRLLSRIDNKEKNWKFSSSDIKEREYWDKYQECYNEAIKHTSLKIAPWYIVPADKKWFARLIISEIIVQTLESIKLEYPTLTNEQYKLIEEARKKLSDEK